MASGLGVVEETIRAHVSGILQKLDAGATVISCDIQRWATAFYGRSPRIGTHMMANASAGTRMISREFTIGHFRKFSDLTLEAEAE